MAASTRVNGKCEVCKESEAKYRCPRCKMVTCSLDCVKKHKIVKDCDGVRDKTEFVAKKEFSDIHLLSDYRFLEDTNRCASNAKRNRPPQTNQRKHYWTERLVKECERRGIKLTVMPSRFFSKRKENTTKFVEIKNKIFWHIEWKFSCVEGSLAEMRIPEDFLLKEVVDKLLISKISLKNYALAGSDNISVLMNLGKKLYSLLDLDHTVCENLKGKTVVEFPTFLVIFKHELEKYQIDNEIKTINDSLSTNEEENIDKFSITDSSDEEIEIEKSENLQIEY